MTRTIAGEPYVVGIGGTTRAASSTEKALRCVLQAAESQGARTRLFGGRELAALPFYAPENADRHPAAVGIVDELRKADALVIASPGYHGSVSGLVKNAVDYIEDLREDERVYLSGMPVGCVATGAGWQSIGATLSALRAVAHALRGWPTPLGAGVNTAGPVFDADGVCVDEKAAFQLRTVGEEVVAFAGWRAASANA